MILQLVALADFGPLLPYVKFSLTQKITLISKKYGECQLYQKSVIWNAAGRGIMTLWLSEMFLTSTTIQRYILQCKKGFISGTLLWTKCGPWIRPFWQLRVADVDHIKRCGNLLVLRPLKKEVLLDLERWSVCVYGILKYCKKSSTHLWDNNGLNTITLSLSLLKPWLHTYTTYSFLILNFLFFLSPGHISKHLSLSSRRLHLLMESFR